MRVGHRQAPNNDKRPFTYVKGLLSLLKSLGADLLESERARYELAKRRVGRRAYKKRILGACVFVPLMWRHGCRQDSPAGIVFTLYLRNPSA